MKAFDTTDHGMPDTKICHLCLIVSAEQEAMRSGLSVGLSFVLSVSRITTKVIRRFHRNLVL